VVCGGGGERARLLEVVIHTVDLIRVVHRLRYADHLARAIFTVRADWIFSATWRAWHLFNALQRVRTVGKPNA